MSESERGRRHLSLRRLLPSESTSRANASTGRAGDGPRNTRSQTPSAAEKHGLLKKVKGLFGKKSEDKGPGSPAEQSVVQKLQEAPSAASEPQRVQPERLEGSDLRPTPANPETDEAIVQANEAVQKMHALTGPVRIGASMVNQTGNPVDLMDSISSFLTTLSKFNSVVDSISTIHPYAQMAWTVLSLPSKVIMNQVNLDNSVQNLLVKMNEVYTFLNEAGLSEIKSMKSVVERISHQTLECSYFIQAYARHEKFRSRLLNNLLSNTAERIESYEAAFDQLLQQFRTRAAGDTLVVVHRIWDKVQGLEQKIIQAVDLHGMLYAEGAGLNEQKLCLDGTRTEILEEITAWASSTDEDTPRVFWLHGLAGTGKSSIAHTIAKRFKIIDRLGSCYCFDRNALGQQRHEKVFSTIARDLADRDEQFREELGSVIRDSSLRSTTDILQQWRELILKPAGKLSDGMAGPIIVVIDAVDESGEPNSRNLLLRILAGKAGGEENQIQSLPPNIRVLLTSRPLEDIHKVFDRVAHIRQKSMDSIEAESTEQDIRSYIKSQLSTLDWSKHDDINNLTKASDRLFEWARLACAFINDDSDFGSTEQERLELVISTKKDGRVHLLDGMYKLTLDTIFSKARDRPKALSQFQSVMSQIIATVEPLTLKSLDIMRQNFHGKDHRDANISVIIRPLGALLSGTTASLTVIRPLHASFVDFLTNQNQSGDYFVDCSNIHNELTFSCLGIMENGLKFNICNLPSSYLPNSHVPDFNKILEQNIPPVLSYTSQFWTYHLQLTQCTTPLTEVVHAFFQHERFLFWLEVLSLMKKIGNCYHLLSDVIQWISANSEFQDIIKDATDAQQFLRIFSGPISLSTPHLYISALPLSPQESRISRKFLPKFHHTLRISKGQRLTWPVLQGVLHGHSGSVHSVAFSPDGRQIVSGSGDNTIRIWDAETGEQAQPPLKGHDSIVESVAFAPSGKQIASGSWDKTVRLWDATSGQQIGLILHRHHEAVSSVAFSQDGRQLVSGSRDRTVRLWDVETQEQVGPVFEEHTSSIESVAFSPDGKQIVAGSFDGTIQLWDTTNGKQLGPPLEGHSSFVVSVAFSPDGKLIASGSLDNTIRLWNASTGEQILPPLKGHTEGVVSVAFSPNGKHIISGSLDNSIRQWDVETRKQLGPPLEGHTGLIFSVAFSPDGRRLVSGSADQTVRLWDAGVAKTQFQPSFKGLEASDILSVVFSPDGNHVVSGSADSMIRQWNAETGQELGPPLAGHEGKVFSVSFSPDGNQIVSGSADKTVRLWNAVTGEEQGLPFTGHEEEVTSVAFSPNGRQIASGSRNTIWLWDVDHHVVTGQLLPQPLPDGHEAYILSVAISPDSSKIISASTDETIRLWDTKTGKQLGPAFEGQTAWTVAISPDGRSVISGSPDSTISVWDMETRKLLHPPLKGHDGPVMTVACSPDGRHIVSGSQDKTIRLWDLKTGDMLGLPLKGHIGRVWSVAFSPDGRQIISVSDSDKTIRLWHVPSPSCSLADNHQVTSHLVNDISDQPQLQKDEYLICFSSVVDHSLRKLPLGSPSVYAFTDSMNFGAESGGWTRIGKEASLLFWSPPMYHPSFFSQWTKWIVPRSDSVELDLSDMVHADEWEKCYKGPQAD